MSGSSSRNPAPIHKRPEELLQKLIRFDTTNPPGNEKACIQFISSLLEDAGLRTTLLGRKPDRPNLVARLEGEGTAPPFLLQGHVDVVTAEGQEWQYPAFTGLVKDACVWGRGALDMKGAIAMMLAALLRVKSEGWRPAGDIVFAALCDEEAGSDDGARYMVEKHPGLFKGVRYALGEVGGYRFHIGEKAFYPLQVAEKQVCWMKARFAGPGGHGSIPSRGGAMGKLGNFLQALDKSRLPVHITPVARQMIETMASHLSQALEPILRQLLDPEQTDALLDQLGQEGEILDAILHHTVNATVVRGGEKVNVIPTEISLDLDGRLLPGSAPEDLVSELEALTGQPLSVEVLRYDSGADEPDMHLFPMLSEVLKEEDPDGIPVPMLTPAFTDARLFSRLGIQTYGFTPLNLPGDFNFSTLIHGPDERVPVEALAFGTRAIYQVLRRYGGGP